MIINYKELKEERVTIRMTRVELSKLDSLKKSLGVKTRSQVIRYLLDVAYSKLEK